VALLLAALADEEAVVRRAALGALEQLGEPMLAMILREIWRGNPEVILLASDPRLVDPLLVALRDGDAGVRCAAAAALGHLGDARATPGLARCLRDPAAPVRSAAAGALGQLRDPQALAPLLQALADSRAEQERAWPDGWNFQNSLLLALGRLGGRPALEALVAALGDGILAPQAARALGVLGDRRAAPALLRCLQSRNPLLRESAVIALGQLGEARAAGDLVRLLADPSAAVSRAAAAALQELGDASLAELGRAFVHGRAERVGDLARACRPAWAPVLLMALLVDRRPATRLAAARLLGESGDPEALPALREQSRWWNEPDAPVRQACREAIMAIRRATGAVGSEPTPAAPPAGSGREGTAV
jgi:HEAT repeat protein